LVTYSGSTDKKEEGMPDSISDESIQVEILDTLDRLSSDMFSRFGKLTQADWDAPSRCDMWSVKDVGSHMVMVFAAYLNFIARSIEGNAMPPEGLPDPGIADGRSFAERLGSRAIEISENDLTTPKALIDRLSELDASLLGSFRSLSDGQWDLPAYHPVNQISPRGLLWWKLLETSIHCWDALNALDDSYGGDARAAVLLRGVWKNAQMNRWFITPDREQVDLLTLDIDLGDTQGLRIINQGGTPEIIDRTEDQSSANAVISVDPSLFALLITARTSLETAIEEGIAAVSGDRRGVHWFNTWFQGS